LLAGILGAGVWGVLVELVVIRRLYQRDHLYQVLATFGLILFTNEAVSMIFGRRPPLVGTPALLPDIWSNFVIPLCKCTSKTN
jgi:branched-chain amino acid transport system permease protein